LVGLLGKAPGETVIVSINAQELDLAHALETVTLPVYFLSLWVRVVSAEGSFSP
jgi:hypothetical protein